MSARFLILRSVKSRRCRNASGPAWLVGCSESTHPTLRRGGGVPACLTGCQDVSSSLTPSSMLFLLWSHVLIDTFQTQAVHYKAYIVWILLRPLKMHCPSHWGTFLGCYVIWTNCGIRPELIRLALSLTVQPRVVVFRLSDSAHSAETWILITGWLWGLQCGLAVLPLKPFEQCIFKLAAVLCLLYPLHGFIKVKLHIARNS